MVIVKIILSIFLRERYDAAHSLRIISFFRRYQIWSDFVCLHFHFIDCRLVWHLVLKQFVMAIRNSIYEPFGLKCEGFFVLKKSAKKIKIADKKLGKIG